MTQLCTPTVYSQLSAPSNTEWDDCGETSVACVVTDVTGQPATPTIVVNTAWSKGQMNPGGTTTWEQLIAELSDWGVPAQYVSGPISSYLPAAIARGHRCILNIGCDGCGRPASAAVTGISHWVVGYGFDNGITSFMNPLGSCTPSLAGMLSSANLGPPVDDGFGIEILAKAICDGGSPSGKNPTQSGGNLAPLLLLGGGAVLVGAAAATNKDLLRRQEQRAATWIRSRRS